MKISQVRASVHAFETVLPIVGKPAGDSVRVVCEVETDDGHVGIGMASRFLAHGVAAAVTRHLAPAVIGLDPRDLEAIHARLHKLVSERGQTIGVNLSALSCIDIALWDIIGKASGRTVAQLLGGHKDHAEVYVTFGFGAYDRDQLVDLARDLITRGHRRFKMLVGVAKTIAEDAARVRHVRDALGPYFPRAIDANESLSLDQAMRLARMVEDCDLAWFEDPVWRNDPRDLARLRARTTIPLSAGQMDGHSERFRAFLEHDAIDIFMPNSLYNGGITETRRVAHLAQIYNRPLSDAGGGGIFCLHHVAGFRNGTLAECHLGVEQVESMLFEAVPEVEDGRLYVPAAPGIGVTLDRSAMKETLVGE
ncbi:mandelate racemase/muconate lactonizing enzyme family protein [soil metagenome]